VNLQNIREEREKWLTWKNIAPHRKKLDEMEKGTFETNFENGIVSVVGETSDEVREIAKGLMPWRKGPFQIGDVFIDSEWQSQIKYSILEPYLDISEKSVADVGCNNGYYMFRMLEKNPKKIVGFDPSPIFKTQFDFINHFVGSKIEYELLGVEHISFYENKFDVILCLGVLYHRSDPIATLRSLRDGLEDDGELILDTFIIDGETDTVLFPEDRYSKMSNIYFIPTLKVLESWTKRAKFKSFELIGVFETTENEQRKTEWIEGQSLNSFLDENDKTKTVEGYPAPKRAYVKIKKS
jgi:tRNA (mo5U34)-methyltransferase